MPCFPVYFLCCLMVVEVLSIPIDEAIYKAAKTPEALSFFRVIDGNPTVSVGMDMLFTPQHWRKLQDAKKSSGDRKRKVVQGLQHRWTNATVPYEIQEDFSAEDKRQIRLSLDHWEKFTCLKFPYATSRDRHKIRFIDHNSCSAHLGMQTWAWQAVNLGSWCRWKTIIIHEVGHVIGFYHEHTRPGRDKYVHIIKRNIKKNGFYNYQQLYDVDNLGVTYDYRSIMHYSAWGGYSVNGGMTMETVDPKFQNIIGYASGLSFRDIKTAHLMYNCNAHCSNKFDECPGEGFVNKDCKCMCPGNPIKECPGTTIGTNTTGNCHDEWPSCIDWAKKGECTLSRSKAYMTDYCRSSCSICQEVKVKDDLQCQVKDVRDDCPAKAKKGDCMRNKIFMAINCRKSCNFCREDGCRNWNKDCEYWEKKGYCTRFYVAYMRSNCPLSCNSC